MAPLVERYTNKRVSLRFSNASIQVDLSQGLFSSFDIDAGTKFLLTVVRKDVDLGKISRLADVGCGTGVIGIAVMKANDRCVCVFQDRDALALEFAKSNCRLNGVAGRSQLAGGLGMQADDRGFDLILSNLPAKAGIPVLSRLAGEISSRLEAGGVSGVVIVSPLADEVGEMLSRCGAEVFHSEDRRGHRVYLFRRAGSVPGDREAGGADYLDPYIRGRQRFSHGGISYELDTAYNLPDFDTLGRETALAMDLIDRRLDTSFLKEGAGRVLIWNPGQGHPAAYLLRRFPELSPDRFILASRDALSLEISGHNMLKSGRSAGPDNAGGEMTARGRTGAAAPSLHVPCLEALAEEAARPGVRAGSGDAATPGDSTVLEANGVFLALLFPQPVPGAHWEEEAALMLARCLAPGGTVIVSAASTEIHRFLRSVRGLVLHGSRKDRGSRAVILKKSG